MHGSTVSVGTSRSCDVLGCSRSFRSLARGPILLLAVLFGLACHMPTKGYPYRDHERSDVLIVMIPGTFDDPYRLEQSDMMHMLWQKGGRADFMVAFEHSRLNVVGKATDRLLVDVIRPARRRGYRRIVLAGVSSGAYVALKFASDHPGEVDDLIAFAPYMGPDRFAEEIRAQGGLQTWEPNPPLENIEYVWFWLKRYETMTDPPGLMFLWGEKDRFVRQFDLIEDAVPDHVMTCDGTHDWVTWSRLWALLLEQDPLDLVPDQPTEIARAS